MMDRSYKVIEEDYLKENWQTCQTARFKKYTDFMKRLTANWKRYTIYVGTV